MKGPRVARWALRVVVVVACAACANWVVAFGCEWQRVRPVALPAATGEGGAVWTGSNGPPAVRRELEAVWPFRVTADWPPLPDSVSEERIGGISRITAVWIRDELGLGSSWIQKVRDFGWPWRSVRCGEIAIPSTLGPWTRESRGSWRLPRNAADVIGVYDLPLGVRPVGFAANTAVYAVVLGVLAMVPGRVRGWWRVRRGRCRACAYPVGVSPVCTECGAGVRAGK